MADEQMQPGVPLDDAIREAEEKLERKLEALRMSALGETGSYGDSGMAASSTADALMQPTAADATPGDHWEDAVMRPVDPTTAGNAGSWTQGGFVPDDDQAGGVVDSHDS